MRIASPPRAEFGADVRLARNVWERMRVVPSAPRSDLSSDSTPDGLKFWVTTGFDGAWIMAKGTDGNHYYVVERAFAGVAGVQDARNELRRIQSELAEWGPDRWCKEYRIPLSAVT